MQEDSIHFIHFGCWNQGGCSPKVNNNLFRVMKKLNIYVEKTNPQFIIVAGDNYYPVKNKDKSKSDEKKETTKLIIDSQLKSGFYCLPENIPIYLLMGNHDLDNGKQLLRVTENGNEKPEECHILNMEKRISKELQLIRPHAGHLVIYELKGSVLFLMIDTSMYDVSMEKDKDRILDCYNKLLFQIQLSFLSLMRKQKNEILEIIRSLKKGDQLKDISKVVIVGHHPLCSFKMKKGKHETIVLNRALNLFYNTIFAEFRYNRSIEYIYLCSDLHQYQVGTIRIQKNARQTRKSTRRTRTTLTRNSSSGRPEEMTIRQYIVGTGGTKLDDAIDGSHIDRKMIERFNVTYEMERSEEKFGFLDCRIVAGETDFTFVPSH
jgi:hypothetical protein